VIHYAYRAVIFPWIQPSMSPLHAIVALAAVVFQLLNATCLGGWLAAYGPTTAAEWRDQLAPLPILQFASGIALFYVGLVANYYHDGELRHIRRREMARLERIAAEQKKSGDAGRPGPSAVRKHYEIPQAGLFKYILYPHYLSEWVEWAGFWMACGWSCAPARTFLVNEIAAMLPRAVRGKKWYGERFGEEKVRRRWAAIPGVW
jgi:3-oxo-5-alpha-steroid 4-dehydrogenase 1